MLQLGFRIKYIMNFWSFFIFMNFVVFSLVTCYYKYLIPIPLNMWAMSYCSRLQLKLLTFLYLPLKSLFFFICSVWMDFLQLVCSSCLEMIFFISYSFFWELLIHSSCCMIFHFNCSFCLDFFNFNLVTFNSHIVCMLFAMSLKLSWILQQIIRKLSMKHWMQM